MTKAIFALPVFLAANLLAQESPSPSPLLTPTPPLAPSASPSTSPTPGPTATSGANTAVRSVRISFVPPPLDGTISLGVYNADHALVRVLHREAKLDEFTIGADALGTKWDGKDNDGHDVPAGKYSARGFLIAPIKIEEIAPTNSAPVEASTVAVKLIANPLENNERPVALLSVGFDGENACLKTTDGLPLITLAPITGIKRAWVTSRPDKSLDVFLDNGTGVRQFHVSGAAKMMAFDCGEFELK